MRRLSLLFLAVSIAWQTPAGAAEPDVLQAITVREGDTVWSIAQFYLKDPKRWPELLKYNPGLSNDPTVALPGMRLKIPVLMIKENLRAAELIYMLNEVLFRRRQSNAWGPAKPHQSLYADDGLRTMAAAGAHVKFPTGETVRLAENSLVIIRPEKKDKELELLSGELRASQARVITAGGAQVNPLSADADYRTRIKPDKAELVLVYRGNVQVTAQGKTIKVPEGFGSEIKPLSTPSDPMPLPTLPALATVEATLPQGSFVKPVMTIDGLTLSVEANDLKSQNLSAAPNAPNAQGIRQKNLLDKYHLEIDAAPDFKSPLLSKQFPVTHRLNVHKLGLEDGTYWWRIAFVDTLGMQGPFSAGQSFVVDKTPPACLVVSPTEGETLASDMDTVQVTGASDPESTVLVNDAPAALDGDGRFSAPVALREGKNRVIVLSKDKQGNLTTVERVVYRLAPGQSEKFQRAQKTAVAAGEEKPAKEGGFASFGLGLLTIGTIIGVFLLVL